MNLERRRQPEAKPHIFLQRKLWVCMVREAPMLGRPVGHGPTPSAAYREWRSTVSGMAC